MKKERKKIIIFLIFFVIIILIENIVYGFGIKDLTGTPQLLDSEKSFFNTLVTVATSIGSVLSVIVLIILGIKYMLGSTEERAAYKKSLLPYFIGCIIIFSASVLAQVIYKLAIKLG